MSQMDVAVRGGDRLQADEEALREAAARINENGGGDE